MSKTIKKRVNKVFKTNFFYISNKKSIEDIIKELENKGIWK